MITSSEVRMIGKKYGNYIDSNAQKWPEDCFYVPTDGERTQ